MQFEDSVWCGRGDLNPHAFWAPPPQDGVSANFTTSARVGIHREYNKFSSGLRGRSVAGSAALKVFREGCKTVELDEPLRGHRWREIVMFQHPGIGMMHVDGVQAGRQRGVDIGTGTVSDHPCGLVHERVPADDLAIGVGMFFRWNLNRGEVHMDAGAVQLLLLLARISFSDQNE